MKVQYQIMELDSDHLRRAELPYGEKQDRICFRLANFDGMTCAIHSTMEEALATIESDGKKYVEYTVIPRVYLNDF